MMAKAWKLPSRVGAINAMGKHADLGEATAAP